MTSTDLTLVGSYDYLLVGLSFVIAILASYAALDLARRVTVARGKFRLLWLTGGATAMGLGIWSMHYVGMLAFRLPVVVQYDWPTVVASLLAAILASAIALFVVSRERMGLIRAVLGSVLMGGGIATMHYVGMAAMRMPAMCSYSAGLVTLSVLLAIAISLVALWLTFHFRLDTTALSWRKMISALVMGLAIPIMHYTGMVATSFTPSTSAHQDLSHAVSVSSLSVAGIVIVTFVVLGAVVLTSLRFDSLPTTRQLGARYFVSLGVIGFLAVVGTLLIERQGGQVRTIGRTINIAGRQRMISQAIAKDALLVERSPDGGERQRQMENLRVLNDLFKRSHSALQHGDRSLGVPGTNSAAIQRMFRALEPHFTAIISASGGLVENVWAHDSSEATADIKAILEHEGPFLRAMDAIVSQYEREAVLPDETKIQLQFALLLAVFGVLLVQGVVVLRPALINIQQGISELELAERALHRKAEELTRSNADLEEFAYVASHDLQEPLRMVASYTQLLSRRYRGRLDADADEFIGFAVDGATRMQILIQELLSYSRVTSKKHALQLIDAKVACDSACENLQRSIEKSGAVVSVGTLPTVLADAGQLTQLFQNLIGNALKYRNERAPEIQVAATANGDTWNFSVRDNGIGIDPQYSERIFQMFQRLHTREEYSGTGMGLAICRKIVERYGGRIWVESELGQGSTFLFTMPRTEGTTI